MSHLPLLSPPFCTTYVLLISLLADEALRRLALQGDAGWRKVSAANSLSGERKGKVKSERFLFHEGIGAAKGDMYFYCPATMPFGGEAHRKVIREGSFLRAMDYRNLVGDYSKIFLLVTVTVFHD